MPGWLDPILNPLACLPVPDTHLVRQESADAILKRLEAQLQQKLRFALGGEKRSIIKGQGLDFADLREYVPGDDIRKIDWNVFARTLTPHVREYHEEKQLTLWLVLDATPSMQFGRARAKLDLAIELAGLFGLMAHQARHKLGGLIIESAGTRILPPKPGYGHLQQVMKAMLETREPAEPPATLSTNLDDAFPVACRQLGHLVQKHSTVMVLSDFLSLSDAWLAPLGQLSRSCQLLHLVIQDPSETQLPAGVGLLPLVDPETGQTLWLDTDDRQTLQAYRAFIDTRDRQLLARLRDTGTAIMARTDAEAMDILLELTTRHATPRRQAG